MHGTDRWRCPIGQNVGDVLEPTNTLTGERAEARRLASHWPILLHKGLLEVTIMSSSRWRVGALSMRVCGNGYRACDFGASIMPPFHVALPNNQSFS